MVIGACGKFLKRQLQGNNAHEYLSVLYRNIIVEANKGYFLIIIFITTLIILFPLTPASTIAKRET